MKDFYKTLRQLGFKRSLGPWMGLISYTKSVGKIVFDVQLFPEEKRGRASIQLGDSFPTGFSTVEGMKTAIQFERKRTQPNSRIPKNRYFNGDNGCKKGLTWAQAAKI